MAEEPIIEVKGLWKRYGLPPFLPWKRRQIADHEWALRDITFSVPRGGSLGILGRNGAGKSTLLKLLAGVTPPDKGSISIRGKVFPMIELTAGMSMELSGRENIRILGTIMGLSGREIERIIPEVVDFSELGDWIYRPVWQYSSGMVGRLAFGIAVHMQADILLVDEVLSTGDIMFQKKCHQKVQELLSGGTTLLFVTHNPYQMEKLCEKGILLEKGICEMQADSGEVMREYLRRVLAASSVKAEINLGETMHLRPGAGDIRVRDVQLLNESGKSVTQITMGAPVTVRVGYTAFEDVGNVNLSLMLFDVTNTLIALIAPARANGQFFSFSRGDGNYSCLIASFPVMGPGLSFTVRINSTYPLDIVENAVIFDAVPSGEIARITSGRGFFYIESDWSI
jgi:ABC-type polysaccharide/polyol phosphate transport system ATPase subunit